MKEWKECSKCALIGGMERKSETEFQENNVPKQSLGTRLALGVHFSPHSQRPVGNAIKSETEFQENSVPKQSLGTRWFTYSRTRKTQNRS